MPRSLIASDNFPDVDDTHLPGSRWSYIRNVSWEPEAPVVISNKVRPLAGGDDNAQVVRWNGAGTFANDQYAKLTIGDLTWQDGAYRVGVVVRCSADTDATSDFYSFWVEDDDSTNRTTKLAKRVNGTQTVLDTRTVAWANGDTISLEVEGTTLRTYRNDVLIFSTTDPALSTGKPGFVIGGAANVPSADTWEGGDITAAGTTHNLTVANCTQTTAVSTVAISTESTGTLTTGPFKNGSIGLLKGLTDLTVAVLDLATMNAVVVLTGQTTDAVTATMTVEDALIVPGTWYALAVKDADDVLGIEKCQAS